MYKYETIIYWSEEDQSFVADVPELPGCMAHGASPDEALANAQEAMQLWLDTAREFSDPIPTQRASARLRVMCQQNALPDRFLLLQKILSASI